MAWLHKRKITNTAASSLPVPLPPSTVHHHSTNWPGIILASVFSVILFIPILWLFWVNLFAYMGSKQPEREAAFWLILVPFVLVAGWLLKWILLAFLDSWFSFRLEIEKEITERMRVELLSLQTSIDPGRMTEADYQFAQVILATMNEAYGYLNKNKVEVFKGRGRPWSIKSVLHTAKTMDVPITQDQAGQVVKWLRSNDVVVGALDGQVNTGRYPDLGRIRELLDKKFGKPIVVNRFPPLRDNWGYDHI